MSERPKRSRPPGSRRICQYWGCRNVERFCPDKRFYCHPNPRIRPLIFHQWLVNSGNLENAESFTKNYLHKRLCSDHFKANDFNPTSKKLKPNAVPLLFGILCESGNEASPGKPTVETKGGEVITCEVDPGTVEVDNCPDMVDTTRGKETACLNIKKPTKAKYVRAADRKGEMIACTPATMDATGGAATAISLGNHYKLVIYPDGKQVFTSVDSELASQLDISSMTSSMNRARKMGNATEVEVKESAEAENIEDDPSPSTSSMQFAASEPTALEEPEFGTFEREMGYVSSAPMATTEEMPAPSQDEEIQTRTITLADIIQTTGDNTMSGSGVKVKPINALQSKHTKAIQASLGGNINVSVNTLETAIQRLEYVSNKLTAASLVDSYDQFGKYISSVLRGLPAKKVLSLKQKIILEVMEAVDQEESGFPLNFPKKAQANAAPEVRSNYGFVTEPSPANLPQDPKSFKRKIPIVGNMPKLYPTIFTPTPSLMVPPVPIVISSMGAATTVNAPPSFVGTKSTSTNALPLPDEAAYKTMDGRFMTATAPKHTLSATFTCDQSSSQSPRGGKRRKTTPAYPTNKAPFPCETATHSATTSGDESSRDDQPPGIPQGSQPRETLLLPGSSRGSSQGDVSNIDQPLKNNEQDFEIDIEEGNELAQIKEDQDLFETVLCGESSSLYIKEEAPDPEEPPEGSPATLPQPPTNPFACPTTCHMCNTKCNSRNDLVTHYASTHPGCAILPSPGSPVYRLDAAGGGNFKT